MNKTILHTVLIGLCALSAAPNGWAEQIPADSKIKQVVVYPDRALVTRTISLKLTPGAHQVLLQGLPGQIENESLSARGTGQAKVKLFGAQLVVSQLQDSLSPKVKELQAELEKLQNQKQQNENQKSALNEKLEFLKSIEAASSDQVGKDIITKQPSVTELQSLVTFLETEFNAVYEKMQALEIAAREMDKEIDRVQRELGQLDGGYGQQQKSSIAVDLEAESQGNFDLEVSYRVPGASWQPVYEARAASDKKEISFTSSALIRQQTGENWDNAQIRLSTAKPALGARMPEIYPWYLSVWEPGPIMPMKRGLVMDYAMEKSKASDGFESEAMSLDAPASVRAELAEASIEAQGPAVEYVLPRPETVLSDWQPRKVTIQTMQMPAEFAYQITPRLSSSAYLSAKVTNGSDALLLPGAVQVFLNDAFVGSSSIDPIGVSESFDLFLGIDERIRVEHKQLKAKVDVSVLPGLHGQTKTVDYSYLTKIENFSGQEAQIKIIDQLPVSQHDEIKIDQISMNPEPVKVDTEKPGVHEWLLKVPAGQKQDVKIDYRVKYPANFRVQGL